MASLWRHGDNQEGGVSPHRLHPVSPQRLQAGVTTDVTLNIKKNLKEEPHPEWAHQPSAADAPRSSMNEKEVFREERLESQTPSPLVESPKGHSEEDRVTLTAKGLTAAEKLDREIWTKWLREWEAALKVCTDPAERMRLGASIQRARSKLNEQRDEASVG